MRRRKNVFDTMSNVKNRFLVHLEELEKLCKRMRGVRELVVGDGGGSAKEVQSRCRGLSACIAKAVRDLKPRVDALLSGSPAYLWDAAAAGHVRRVLRLLQSGANPRQRDAEGRTALHRAATATVGHERCVAFLVEFGAPVNAADRRGRTALHYAVEEGHVGATRRLLKAGSDVDRLDACGDSPLTIAVSHNRPDLVSLLLRHHAYPFVRDRNGYTVLWMAAKNGMWEVVKAIAAHPEVHIDVTDNEGKWVMVYATMAQQRDVMTVLLDRDGWEAFKERRRAALRAAVERSDGETVRQILSGREELGNEDLIYILCRVKDASVLRIFESCYSGILQGEIGQSAMRFAAQHGFVDSMKCLLDGGVDVDAVKKDTGGTALIFASKFGQSECVNYLLKQGAFVDQTNDKYCTALHCASENGYEDIVRILLEAGADANIQNLNQETPVDVAKAFAVRKLFSSELST